MNTAGTSPIMPFDDYERKKLGELKQHNVTLMGDKSNQRAVIRVNQRLYSIQINPHDKNANVSALTHNDWQAIAEKVAIMFDIKKVIINSNIKSTPSKINEEGIHLRDHEIKVIEHRNPDPTVQQWNDLSTFILGKIFKNDNASSPQPKAEHKESLIASPGPAAPAQENSGGAQVAIGVDNGGLPATPAKHTPIKKDEPQKAAPSPASPAGDKAGGSPAAALPARKADGVPLKAQALPQAQQGQPAAAAAALGGGHVVDNVPPINNGGDAAPAGGGGFAAPQNQGLNLQPRVDGVPPKAPIVQQPVQQGQPAAAAPALGGGRAGDNLAPINNGGVVAPVGGELAIPQNRGLGLQPGHIDGDIDREYVFVEPPRDEFWGQHMPQEIQVRRNQDGSVQIKLGDQTIKLMLEDMEISGIGPKTIRRTPRSRQYFGSGRSYTQSKPKKRNRIFRIAGRRFNNIQEEIRSIGKKEPVLETYPEAPVSKSSDDRMYITNEVYLQEWLKALRIHFLIRPLMDHPTSVVRGNLLEKRNMVLVPSNALTHKQVSVVAAELFKPVAIPLALMGDIGSAPQKREEGGSVEELRRLNHDMAQNRESKRGVKVADAVVQSSEGQNAKPKEASSVDSHKEKPEAHEVYVLPSSNQKLSRNEIGTLFKTSDSDEELVLPREPSDDPVEYTVMEDASKNEPAESSRWENIRDSLAETNVRLRRLFGWRR
ncbi:MAG: hypothetical protein H0W88_06445 [Parachlamydiaceae bacterium]|nr:hypothetical protein [Parachlamydiaceae bacterium]